MILDNTSLELAGPDPAEVLHRVFGHPGFRGRQEEIIRHVVSGGSGLVLMPTGGGKSLCYQVPALIRPGVGVVVSPLIALMQDQVAALREAGVRGKRSASTERPRYSGRKWWPHWLTQCASSTANRAMCRSARRERVVSSVRRSGET